MHYVKQFSINGVATKQVACIELHGKPNAATEGYVGVLGIDVDSPLHDVYKCVAVNGSIYTWDLLSSGLSIMSANISGGGVASAQFPYTNLRTPPTYVVKIGDLILDNEGYLYQIDALNSTYCAASYCGTQVVAYGKSAYKLAVEHGFEGSEEEWLDSLHGKDGELGKPGDTGKSAYQQAVEGGYKGSEVEFEQKLARDIPTVTQTTGDSPTLVMSQKAVTDIVDSINVLPYGGSKDWLEKNGDRTKLYQIDGYVWGYIVSDGWTKSGTQFNIVSSTSQMAGANEIQYFLRNGSNGTVYEYHEASGDIGVPVYSTKPTTAKEGDIIAVGGRKYKASVTSTQEPAYTDLAHNFEVGRFNSSGNIDATATEATACTDYVGPLKINDVIRIKGFGALDDYNVVFYNNNKGCFSSSKPAGWSATQTSYSYDSSTKVATITLNVDSNSWKYFRASGILEGTTDDVIITLNEEIKTKTVTTITWTDIGEYVPPVEAGWSETDETYPIIESLSTTANNGTSAVYSADGFVYSYIAGSDWMATSKYTPKPLDGSLSETSSNAVQNKVVTAAINELKDSANKNAENILTLQNEVESLGGVDASNQTIPSYWDSMIASKTATVKALQEAGGKNCVSFAWAADTHIDVDSNLDTGATKGNTGGRTRDLGKVMAKMLDNCEVPFALISGDINTRASWSTEELFLTALAQIPKDLAPLWDTDRLVMCLGNHDGTWGDKYDDAGSGYYKHHFTPERMWSTFFRGQSLDFRRVFSDDGLYFYIDNNAQKTRMIVLNSHFGGIYAEDEKGWMTNKHFCYGQAQLDWLSNTALDMPEGYSAIITMHVPIWNKGSELAVDANQVRGIINAYCDRGTYSGSYTGSTDNTQNSRISVDFTNAKGDIIGVFAGHVHGDDADTTTLRRPIITILAAGAPINDHLGYTAPPRYPWGTDQETSFDIVTINKSTRTIYCTRVGAGNDRSFTY